MSVHTKRERKSDLDPQNIEGKQLTFKAARIPAIKNVLWGITRYPQDDEPITVKRRQRGA